MALTEAERRKRANRVCTHGYDTKSCPIHKWDVIPIKGRATNEQSSSSPLAR